MRMEYKTNKLITLNSSFKHINELNPGGVSVLPHKQWELVRRIGHKYGIGVTDLTPALIEESDNLLHEGRLTFWKDDTHWNKNGISIAAEILARSVFERN